MNAVPAVATVFGVGALLAAATSILRMAIGGRRSLQDHEVDGCSVLAGLTFASMSLPGLATFTRQPPVAVPSFALWLLITAWFAGRVLWAGPAPQGHAQARQEFGLLFAITALDLLASRDIPATPLHAMGIEVPSIPLPTLVLLLLILNAGSAVAVIDRPSRVLRGALSRPGGTRSGAALSLTTLAGTNVLLSATGAYLLTTTLA